MKIVYSVLIICLFAAIGCANDVFIANTSLGGNTGTNCANALVYTYFNNAANWSSNPSGILIGPGTTVHVCNLISAAANTANILAVQGSGTNGSPVLIFFEAGSGITTPTCRHLDGTGGLCMTLGGFSFITVDGNGTTPTITCTQSGDAFSTTARGCGGIGGIGPNSEIKNASITNMYVNTGMEANAGAFSDCIDSLGQGNHIKIHNNNFDHCYYGILLAPVDGVTDMQIYNNTFNHTDWHIGGGPGSTATISGIVIHDNIFHDHNNWDDTVNNNHHNDVYIFGIDCLNQSINNTKIYNNFSDGNFGQNATSHFFFQCGIHGMYIFNNVVVPPLPDKEFVWESGNQNAAVPDTNEYFINNTVIVQTGGSCFATSAVNTIGSYNNIWGNCGTYKQATIGSNVNGPAIDYEAYDSGINTNNSAMAWLVGATTYAAYKAANPTFDVHSITPATFGLDVNYHPVGNSAVISAGTNLTGLLSGTVPELLFDKGGNPRSASSAWDIGAYALNPVPTCTRPTITGVVSNSTPWYVTINGTGFGPAPYDSTVTVNGQTALPVFWSPTSIQVPLPAKATTGNVVVTVCNQASNGVLVTITRQ